MPSINYGGGNALNVGHPHRHEVLHSRWSLALGFILYADHRDVSEVQNLSGDLSEHNPRNYSESTRSHDKMVSASCALQSPFAVTGGSMELRPGDTRLIGFW
jgi:hypothetical protein